MVAAVVLWESACGCPRHGEPPVTVAPHDTDDVGDAGFGTPSPAVGDAGVYDGTDAGTEPPPPPEPLPSSFLPVPRIGHAGPVWAVPARDGVVIGIDAQGGAKWWSGLAVDAPAVLLRSEHLRIGGITAVAAGGRPGAPIVALGTAGGPVLRWRPAPPAKPSVPPQALGEPLSRAVSAVAVSPDGSVVAAATAAGEVHVLDEHGAELWTRDRDHADRISDLAFSPDGKRLAGACVDGLVSVWEVSSGLRRIALPTDGPVLAVAFSPDGLVLAAGTATRGIQLWAGDPLAPTVRRDLLPAAIDRLAFGAGGVLYAADEAGEIQVLDAATLDGPSLADASHFPCSTILPARCLRAHEGRLRSLVVDETNGLLAGGEDGVIRRLAVAEGDRGATPAAQVLPLVVLPAPDGDEVAVGLTDGTIVRLDAATGRERRRATGHADAVTGLAWLPGGTLLSASLDGTLRLWKTGEDVSGQTLHDHHRPVTALALSPDGARAASGGLDGAILVWTIEGDRLEFAATLEGHVSRVLALSFDADGDSLWSAGLDRTVERWNLARRRSFWRHPLDVRPAPTRLFPLADGGMVVGRADGALQRVDARRGAAALRVRCAGPVLDFLAAPDAPDAALVRCGDGSLRRADGLATESVGSWTGEPLFPGDDAAGACALLGDRAVCAGETVSLSRPGDSAESGTAAPPIWRTWFVPGGSLTIDEAGDWSASGDGAVAVSYTDRATARDASDPSVGLRRSGAAARGEP